MDTFFFRWADLLSADNVARYIRTTIIGFDAKGQPVHYTYAAAWGLSLDMPDERSGLQEVGVGFRHDRLDLAELFQGFPASLEISFPLKYPEKTFRNTIVEQRRQGLASLELLSQHVRRALAAHLRRLAYCKLHRHVLRTFDLKEPNWPPREQIEMLTAAELRPLISLRSMHFNGKELVPGSELNKNLQSGENELLSIQLNLEEEHLPVLPDHRVVREALFQARQAAICLRYWWEIEEEMRQVVWGAHAWLATQRSDPMREAYIRTLEMAIEIKQKEPTIKNRPLYKRLSEQLTKEGDLITPEGVRKRLNKVLKEAGVQNARTYRLESLKQALDHFKSNLS
ncbi:hypothetical protein [Rhodothermus marinus]|uniref:hypothetical protein n=1 Tax=Rhodothermus marinus TaxID=29549 RepID=UPI0012BA41A1|nr:hypothetical protein [Rhodothermus marinus]BBM68221.1 hypothetical protein RmaAA213_00670 [Rhodothermus marinus]